MHLQRPDAGSEVDDAINLLLLEPFINHMHLEAQIQIKMGRAELDEEIAVASAADHNRLITLAEGIDDGRLKIDEGGLRFGQGGEFAMDEIIQGHGLIGSPGFFNGNEGHLVAGPQLPEFPQFGIHHHAWADEATEAGPVRTKDHRHVTGEVHRADRVGVVMDVRWVQSRFTTICTSPFRLRPDEPHPCAGGVVMHLPCGGEKSFDIFLQEKIRCPVRPVKHADLPFMGQRHRYRAIGDRQSTIGNPQHIPRQERTPEWPAETAQRECGRAAKILRRLDAASHCQIRAGSGPLETSDLEHIAGFQMDGAVHFQCCAVSEHQRRCPNDGDGGSGVES